MATKRGPQRRRLGTAEAAGAPLAATRAEGVNRPRSAAQCKRLTAVGLPNTAFNGHPRHVALDFVLIPIELHKIRKLEGFFDQIEVNGLRQMAKETCAILAPTKVVSQLVPVG